jgi:hypothetical protein
MPEAAVVDAVLVKRCASPSCSGCGDPLVVVADEIELGHVYRVDRATIERAAPMIAVCAACGARTRFALDLVIDVDAGSEFPAEVLMYDGAPL